MTDILSFPFRLAGDGNIATVDQDGDEAAAEQLALLLLVRHGERPLVPDYGVTDPLGRGLDPNELAAAAARFGPDVSITDVVVEQAAEGVQQVTIRWE